MHADYVRTKLEKHTYRSCARFVVCSFIVPLSRYRELSKHTNSTSALVVYSLLLLGGRALDVYFHSLFVRQEDWFQNATEHRFVRTRTARNANFIESFTYIFFSLIINYLSTVHKHI